MIIEQRWKITFCPVAHTINGFRPYLDRVWLSVKSSRRLEASRPASRVGRGYPPGILALDADELQPSVIFFDQVQELRSSESRRPVAFRMYLKLCAFFCTAAVTVSIPLISTSGGP